MRRVKFIGMSQREFFDLVIERLDAPSLRGLLQFGFNINYSTLKNYYNEDRLMPGDLFNDLCGVARIEASSLGVEYLESNWGQVKGGKLGKRKKS